MQVTIEDPQLDRELQALSFNLGRSVDEIVIDAVQEKLKSMRLSEKKIDWDVVRNIQDEVAKMAVLDRRSDDEVIGYNDLGHFDE